VIFVFVGNGNKIDSKHIILCALMRLGLFGILWHCKRCLQSVLASVKPTLFYSVH
jgi:hypothetical protein